MKRQHILSVIIVFFIAACNVSALSAQSKVSIYQSEAIIQLVDAHKALNRSRSRISGWSVQLLSSNERDKVTQLKGVFMNTYPDVKVDWNYDAPYYKLQAGAFKTKMEANRLLEQIRSQFPDAYVVKNNNISPLDLL